MSISSTRARLPGHGQPGGTVTSKRAAETAATLEGLEDGPRRLMRLAVNMAAEARGLRAPWDPGLSAGTAERLSGVIGLLAPADPASWGAAELGSLYEAAVAADVRKRQGIWFTPEPLAQFMTQLAIPGQRVRVREPGLRAAGHGARSGVRRRGVPHRRRPPGRRRIRRARQRT